MGNYVFETKEGAGTSAARRSFVWDDRLRAFLGFRVLGLGLLGGLGFRAFGGLGFRAFGIGFRTF